MLTLRKNLVAEIAKNFICHHVKILAFSQFRQIGKSGSTYMQLE